MDLQEKSKLLNQVLENGNRVKNNNTLAMRQVRVIREIAGDYLNEQSFTPKAELPPCYLIDIKQLPFHIGNFDAHLKQWQEFSASVHAFLDRQDQLQAESKNTVPLKEEVTDHPDFFKWVESADQLGFEGEIRYDYINARFNLNTAIVSGDADKAFEAYTWLGNNVHGDKNPRDSEEAEHFTENEIALADTLALHGHFRLEFLINLAKKTHPNAIPLLVRIADIPST